MGYLDIIQNRRSVYALSREIDATREEVNELVGQTAQASPSPFNVQSARALILWNGEGRALWGIVSDALAERVPAEQLVPTREKLDRFAAAAGTILFYDDTALIDGLKQAFPTYRDNFDSFADQAQGMFQVNVWNALAERGIGASLQHYNPLIDDAVRERWSVPETWRLVAQMPFGGIEDLPAPADKLPASERVKSFG